MSKLSKVLSQPIFARAERRMRLIIKAPCIIFRSFPYNIFYISTSVSVFLTLLLTPFAATLDKTHLFRAFTPGQIRLLENASRSILLDPFLIHVVTAFFASWLLFEIAEVTLKNSTKKSIDALFISTLPWILLLASYILIALVFKPAFDYQRPFDYDLGNEPPLVNIFHRIMGAGQAAPSGFVVRQMVLMLTVLVLNKEKSTPLKKKIVLYAVNTLVVFSVILVGLLRVCVGSHTLFDITFAIGCGAIIFWLIYVIPYSLLNQNGAVTTVCVVFLLFVGLFVFYAHNPRYWIISAFITIGCLLLLDIVPEFLSSLINKQNPT